jgi:hypothetical protein
VFSRAVLLAMILRSSRVMSAEILIGRGLACCLNPRAAWRVLPRAGRAMVVVAYAGAGFVATITVLVLL